ncbi:MAG: hypothetical protein CSA86_03300 [Arcobacter sp.]|nr:MAG: hypothetical protein CSA86_03300 [Arcobacter sp.]
MKKYLLTFVVVFVAYLVGDAIYTEMTKDKTPGKAKRLPCQKKVTSFERSFSDPDVKYVQSLIEQGSVEFASFVEPAKYAKSTLFEYITLEEMDSAFKDYLHSYVKYNETNEHHYKLYYYVYENDKKDPGKKSAKSKLYAGYVVLEVKNTDNKSIYKVQIDLMDPKGSDIVSTIKCAIKSLMTYKK